MLTLLTCWLVRRLWEAERHHQSLATFSSINNASTKSCRVAAPNGGNNVQPSATAAGAAATATIIPPNEVHRNKLNLEMYTFNPFVFTFQEISLTQQLEMRQLTSAMMSSTAAATAAASNVGGNVQIIVTEVPSTENSTNGHRNKNRQPQYSSTVLDCSSYVMGIGPSMVIEDDISCILPNPIAEDDVTIAPCADPADPRAENPVADGAEGEAVGTGPPKCNSRRRRRQHQMAKMTLNMTSQQRHKHQTDRTTRMLVAVLVVFLITEIPQGVVALLSGILGRQFFTRCYTTGMGEILDLLALFNSAINFLLYCSMSRAFRRAARAQFSQLFHRSPQANNNMMNEGGEAATAAAAAAAAAGAIEVEMPIGCCTRSPINCFQSRQVGGMHHQPANISPSNPTRCTQL